MNERVLLPAGAEPLPVTHGQGATRRTGESTFTWLVRTDELSQGQIVIVTARWILVAAVLGLALWNANVLGELRIQIMAVLALAGMNFYIHAHLLMKRPFPQWAVYAASVLDLTLITIITAVQGGFGSNVFLFYFPAILGFSVAFPSLITISLVGVTAFWYGLICLATGHGAADAYLILTSRLVILAGTTACGILYQRLERRRRETAVKTLEQLRAEIRDQSRTPLPGIPMPGIRESRPTQEGV